MTLPAVPKVKRYCLPNPSAALIDEILVNEIEPGSRVIDLGCGDGRLLEVLRERRECSTLGVEVDTDAILQSLKRGVPVIQSDLDRGVPEIPDDSFDYAVLSQTLQQVRLPRDVLTEMLRIARKALVVVPNFGHWRVRLQVVRYGRAPVTEALPYEWYNSPNLHFMSMHDFRELVTGLGYRITRELPIIKGTAKDRAWAANLRADSAMYLLERPESS
ncbi:MAG: methionine biosynthesis protein MetW [Planctomycetaceae bacterium]